EEDILQKTFEQFQENDGKRLTEKELTDLVNKVYANVDIESNKSYQEGLKKHIEIQERYNFIKDLTSDADVFTREGLDTVSVIPNDFEEEYFHCSDKDTLSNLE